MNIIASFKIDKDDSIEVLIPNFIDKENYYYQPVQELHMFDIVTVEYRTKTASIILKKDSVSEIFICLRNTLELLAKRNLNLPKNFNQQSIGYQWNIDTDKDNFEIDYSHYWLFSTRGIQTWVYNKNKKIYLEISPSYRWHYVEPLENEKVVSFSKFMEKYKPLAVYELTEETIKKWAETADYILKKMIRVEN